jgi:tetratricopeptide (TPR) repeat protein
VLIDDLHLAEPTLLDLLEYIIGFASGAPMLLLCLARAELFESRPSWAVPRQNASLVPLQPISDGDAGMLIEELVTRELSAEARVRVAQAAEGNPLFIEQLLALNAGGDASNGSLLVPPTIQALLAARIDRLDERDRAVIERASIEGRSFHRGAVEALLEEPARATVGASLISLGRKEFIQPDQALFSGDDAFRFGHILIRDAAYEAVPKQLRAELHERFANWLEHMADSRLAEYEEILGYHLEQAHRYQAELGRGSEARRLAELAGQRLASAGLRAQARGDMPAVRGLLTRAASLLPADDSARLLLLPELAAAFLDSGDLSTAEATLREAEQRARACGNELAVWRATIGLIELHCWSGAITAALITSTKEAQAACTRLGDELGLARAWLVLGLTGGWFFGAVGTILDSDTAFQQAIVHARLADARREESAALRWLIITGWFGPIPATEGIRRCNEILELPTDKSLEATALIAIGCFLATQGKFDEARSQFNRGYATIEDLGQQLLVAGSSQELFDIEMLAGNPAAAERRLRTACETLEQIGEQGFLGTRLGCLAEAIYAQGRHAEAEEMSKRAESAVSQTMDVDAQFRWRAVRGKVLAQRGEDSAAEALVREAVALIGPTDWLNARAGVQLDLAEVLELAGRRDEAMLAVTEALHLFEAKENVVAARRVRDRLATLGVSGP